MTSVVVVDDRDTVRQIIQYYLESEADLQIVGFADNGKTALEQLERLKPDIVLMDIDMPVMDGITATQIIVQRDLPTKVIMLTGDNDRNLLERAIATGASGYIFKDADPDEIRNIIRLVDRGYFQIGASSSNVSMNNSLEIRYLLSEVEQLQQTLAYQDESLNLLKNRCFLNRRIIGKKINSERFFVELKNIQFDLRKLNLRIEKLENNFIFLRNLFVFTIVLMTIVILLLSYQIGFN